MNLRRNTKPMNLTSMRSRGPIILIAVLFSALLGLSSCGGGGSEAVKDEKDMVMVMPPVGGGSGNQSAEPPPGHVDESDTVAGAKLINVGEQITGYIDKPGDVDYFRMSLSGASGEVKMTLDAPTGTTLTVLDTDGNELARGTTKSVLVLPVVLPAATESLVLGITAAAGVIGRYLLTGDNPQALEWDAIWKDEDPPEVTVKTGEEFELGNLGDYLVCVASNPTTLDPTVNCELEGFIFTKFAKAYVNKVPILEFSQSGELKVITPCETESGNYGAQIEVTTKIGTRTRKHTVTLPIEVKGDGCNEPYFVEVSGQFHADLPTQMYYLVFNNKDAAKKACDILASQAQGLIACSQGPSRLYEGDCISSYVKNATYYSARTSTASSADEQALSKCGGPLFSGTGTAVNQCLPLIPPGNNCGAGSPFDPSN